MNRIARIWAGGAAAAVLLVALPPHITPTVTLVSHADAIKQAIGGAAHYFARTVDIGRNDLASIKREASYTPDQENVRFYYGTDDAGKLAGIILFPEVNTQHGPLEVGLALDPNGTVLKVIATKATVETKPWVEAMVKSGYLDHFTGLHVGDDAKQVLAHASKHDLGAMPYWTAEIATLAVQRGLVLYQVLFAPHVAEIDRRSGK
jgi:hypothetical protein